MRQTGVVCDFGLDKLSVADVEKGSDDLIKRIRTEYEKVGNLKQQDVTFENCLQALLNIDVQMSNEEPPFRCSKYVVTDKDVREASVAADKKLNAFRIEMSMNKNVFDNVTAFKDKFGVDKLTPEIQRYVEKTIVNGKRNGLHLDESKREEVQRLKTKMSDLSTTFSSNLTEENTVLTFSEQELAGVPQDLIDSFEKTVDGKCKVTLKYPHYFPIIRKCRVPETRRLMATAFNSRCKNENTKILEELASLRHQMATMLGYKNHAAYIHEVRMAKDPDTVAKFLLELAEKLQPLWTKEKEEMLKLKEEECKKYGYEFNGELDFWDSNYYTTLIEETRYAVDKELLKEYFPMDTVTKGMLKIYQDLLGLKFIECTQDVDKWHDEVKLYRVDDLETNETLGYFYLDLHPREGKFGHAAVESLQPGCITPSGERQPSVCVMVANFSKPTESKPSLLDHRELETYFHEFGHVMHVTCARTETVRFAGYEVERDFIEAPSQMLENWCWQEESIRLMSGHYKDGSPIPNDLLEKLIASRKANAGSFNLRQIILATFDQLVHTRDTSDTCQIYADLYSKLLGIRTIEGTSFGATFDHMGGMGYDAQYYGYMWSEVYSFDMFEGRFKKEGLLNPKAGSDYRTLILQPGGSKDAIDLLRDFLGREPSDEAFLKSKGLY